MDGVFLWVPYNHFTSLQVAWNDQENKDGRYEECREKLERKTSSFPSKIFKSLSFRLDRLCHLAILCLDQHAHSLNHLEILLTISLDRLDIFEGRSCISEFFKHEHVVMNPTSAGMRYHHLHLYIQRISLTGFPAQSVGSSNTDVLDLPCLLVLITGTSQSRQHVDTSLIHIESRKSPTTVLFDDDTGRISIRHCEY
ncbi:hypothetical protein Tco_1231056 [Tanacetum coccineum]